MAIDSPTVFESATLFRIHVMGNVRNPMTIIIDDDSGVVDRLAAAARLIYNTVDVVGVGHFMGGGSSQGSVCQMAGQDPNMFVESIVEQVRQNIPNTAILPTDPSIGKVSLYLSNISPDSILGVLAACGIECTLPRLYPTDQATLAELKERFSSERECYIDALREYVGDVYQGLKNEDYKDVYQYAQYNTNQILLARVRDLERAVKNSDKKFFTRITAHSLEELPVIGAGGASTSFVDLGVKILKVLCMSLSERFREESALSTFKDVKYLYYMKNDRFDKQNTRFRSRKAERQRSKEKRRAKGVES